jgi:AcrR family transcriptional regulator
VSCGTIHAVVQPASRGPGRPPAAKAAETRKRILRAAREVFSERGYDAATFQAIAIRADLTRPAINHYFANKRVLYWQVLDETNDAVVTASVQRARGETTLTRQVSAFIEGAIDAEIENRTAAAFLITAALESQRHPELRRPGTDSVSTTRAFLLWAINDGIQRGELDVDTDASALTEMLLAVLLGVGFYAGFIASRHELDPVTDQLKLMLARSLTKRPDQVQ